MTDYTVDTVSDVVSAMLTASQPTADIIAGGANMRAKGKTHLPQFPQEDDESYKARLASTWLFNGVKKTREDMTGKIFNKPVRLANPENNPLNEWMANVDMEGRDLSNFAVDVLNAAMERGLSFILVDAPKREKEEMTKGEVKALGYRPSMTLVRLDEVYGWQWANIANAPTLTQVRIAERVPDPARGQYSDETIAQIRVLDRIEGGVQVTLHQNRTSTNGSKTSGWEIVDQYMTEATEIMFTPVYTDRVGFMLARSPLEDITEINMAHWRSQSDQANIMHYARVFMMYFHGYSLEHLKEITQAPGMAIHNANEAAQVGVVEHSGSAISAGRDELKDLEFQMQAMGLQLVMEKTGGGTATGDTIDEKKATSRLAMWADNLKDALEISIGHMADMGGLTADTDVMVNKEFSTLDHLSMPSVAAMHSAGVISSATYIEEGKRRGILDERTNPDDEAERILEDAMSYNITDDMQGGNGNGV